MHRVLLSTIGLTIGLTLSSSNANALMPARHGATNTYASPSCLKVESTYTWFNYREVFDVPLSDFEKEYNVRKIGNSKGAAAVLINECDTDIVISLEKLYHREDNDRTYQVKNLDARIFGIFQKEPFPNGRPRSERVFLWNFIMDQGGGDCEYTEEVPTHVEKENLEICSSIRIPSSDFNRLLVPVYYDVCFEFSGHALKTEQVVTASGCIIKPGYSR